MNHCACKSLCKSVTFTLFENMSLRSLYSMQHHWIEPYAAGHLRASIYLSIKPRAFHPFFLSFSFSSIISLPFLLYPLPASPFLLFLPPFPILLYRTEYSIPIRLSPRTRNWYQREIKRTNQIFTVDSAESEGTYYIGAYNFALTFDRKKWKLK